MTSLANRLVPFHARRPRRRSRRRPLASAFVVGLPDVVQVRLRLGLSTDFGIAFSTFMVLCSQHRCSRVVGNTSRRRPRTRGRRRRWPVFGSCLRPRRLRSSSTRAIPPPPLSPPSSRSGCFRESRRSWPTAPCDVLVPAPTITRTHCFFLSHARLEVDAVGPDVEKPPSAEVALFPSLVSDHQSAFSRVIVVADEPLAFGPSSAASASLKSPEDRPFR